jgi:hypothetical protein
MSKHDTEQVVASAFHTMRAAAKKARRATEHDIARERFRRMQQRENARFSIYPPGWVDEGL